jgi:membrane protein
VAIFAILAILIIGAPLALSLIERYLGFSAPFGVGLLRYLVGLSVFAAFLALLHMLLPSRRPPPQSILPGILVTVALWALGATGFSIYLSFAPSFSITYGAFAGVIVTLLFFYLTGAAIIFGAEVNAALIASRGERRARPVGDEVETA